LELIPRGTVSASKSSSGLLPESNTTRVDDES
jgi:hypothetical protein